jgi:hypothetical protein
MKQTRISGLPLLLISISLSSMVFAQAPVWTASLGNIGFDKINYVRKAGTSTVLIATENKVYGVSSTDKKIIWEQEISTNITDSTIKVHEGTPFVTLFKNKNVGKQSFFVNNKYVLLNSETGQTVYSNLNTRENIMSETYLQQKNAILTVAKESGGAYVALRSFKTGDELWRKSFSKAETRGKGLLGGLMKLAGVFILIGEENNDVANSIILYTYDDVYCLDAETGKELWKKSFEKRITNAVRSSDLKYLFVQDAKFKVNYLDVSTGKEVLSTPFKERAEIYGVDYTKNGYVVKTAYGINLLNNEGVYTFNSNIGYRLNAYQVDYLDDGYLISNYKSSSRIEQENSKARQETGGMEEADYEKNNRTIPLEIGKFGFDGKQIWAKTISQANARFYTLEKGIMLINEDFATMYGYSSGEMLWPSGIQLKGETSFGYDYDSAKIYAFNKKSIECFNIKDGSYKNITSNFEFKEKLSKDEKVFITPIKEGVFINSNQNYALVDFNGNTVYNNNLVDASGFTKKFKNTVRDVSTLISVIGEVKQGIAKERYTKGIMDGTITREQAQKYGKSYEKGKDIESFGDKGIAIADKLDALKRNSEQSKKTVTIFSNDGKPCAVIIDKATGVIKRKIRIADLNPILYVDDSSNSLYMINSLLQLSVYDLN